MCRGAAPQWQLYGKEEEAQSDPQGLSRLPGPLLLTKYGIPHRANIERGRFLSLLRSFGQSKLGMSASQLSIRLFSFN